MQLISIIQQYHVLLKRYACRLLQRPELAGTIVTEVFEQLYEEDKLLPGPQLRPTLKTATLHKCEAYNKAYAVYRDALHTQIQNENPANL